MTQYELKLREIAEKMARFKHADFHSLRDSAKERAIQKHMHYAALCLEKMAEAGTELYKRRTQQGDLQHHLTALGYKKAE